jgi:hypothetical protein
MHELKRLLGNAPSVRRFNKLLAGLPEEERKRHYHHAYHVAMHQWSNLPKRYQVFLFDLVKHDWQRFLDYVHQETILGVLIYPVEDAERIKKMIKLMAKNQTNQKVSYNHLAFCLLMSFGLDLQISTLGDQIRTISFYPEEMYELLECVRLLV